MILSCPLLLSAPLEYSIYRNFSCFAAFARTMFAVAQLASTNNKAENLNKVVNLITEAAEKGAKVSVQFCRSIFPDGVFTRGSGFHWDIERRNIGTGRRFGWRFCYYCKQTVKTVKGLDKHWKYSPKSKRISLINPLFYSPAQILLISDCLTPILY